MGFTSQRVWSTGYCGPMGYGTEISAHRVGGHEKLWDIRDYGLSEVWVERGSTIFQSKDSRGLPQIHSKYRPSLLVSPGLDTPAVQNLLDYPLILDD